MQIPKQSNRTGSRGWQFPALAAFVAGMFMLLASMRVVHASQAYGTINNFDVVNDNGVECHGFEVELDDCQSADISYTFDYNHYGTPKISEDTSSNPGHTNVHVLYAAVWTNTGWSAFTAVPAGPIAPTLGHQFTNPGTNFGGEHFGMGYRSNPSKVFYYWMVDNGSHTLTRGGQVNVTTPVFTYTPPAVGVQAVAAAVIPAPVPVVPPPYEFSDASWVKVITTTSHTNTEVKIGDLMSTDPENPNGKDWRNGQTNVEVETEWQLLQIDYMSGDYNPTNGVGGPNGKLAGPNHNLGKSDDVVTYRYEYYAYVGPYDDFSEPPTHEAFAQTVAANGTNGTGTYSNTVVVGKFLGAQMSALAGSPPLGLIDHLPDGEVGVSYPTRSLVIAQDTNFVATTNGSLPSGMAFDAVNGRVYGTPSEAGNFLFTVTVTASNNPVLKKTYPFMVGAGGVLPPHSTVDTGVSLPDSGSTTGDGVYTNGTTATVDATPNAGYGFANWTDNGIVVSASASYTFTNIVNRTLVANFAPAPPLSNAPVTLSNLSQTYDGNGKIVLASTDPVGLTVDITYDGVVAAPTNAGSYTVVGTVNDPNYVGSATNTLVIAPAVATVTLSNLSQTYDGNGKSVPASTVPTGLNLDITYDGAVDAPTNAGSYTVIGTVSDTNYVGSVTNTLVVAQAGATVTLSNLSQAYDGTARSVTVSTFPTGLVVNVTYNGSPDAPTNVGNYTVVGTISELNYQGNNTQTLNITNNAPPGNPAVLTVIINGTGTTSITGGSTLKLGKTYNITAKPGLNNLFSNWLVSVNGGPVTDESALAKYTFTMQSNLTLTVNFVTNRFLDAAGSYNGLFQSDTGDNGFFTVKVTPKNGKPATFSGRVNIDGTKTPFKGTFDLDGAGTFGSGGLAVSLQLPFDNSGTISGTLTNLNGTSDMLGYVADGSSAYTGRYTMVVPGNFSDSTIEPGGNGYGLLSINSKGVISLTGGRLADAALFKQSVAIGKGGMWPLYSTSAAGSIRGWLTVSTNGDIGGTLTWGSDGTGTGYTNGFELVSAAQGGLYVAPALSALPTLICGDGLLTTTVTNTAGKFTFAKTEVKKLVVTAKTGKVQLGIINGTAAGEGVVLGTNVATGYLLHTGVSSWFDLQ